MTQDLELLALLFQRSTRLKLPDWHESLKKLEAGASLLALMGSHQEVYDSIKKEWDDLSELGATILYPGHPLYPHSYFFLERPPLCLTTLGRAEHLAGPGLAVVGSRNLHSLSAQWMDDELSSFLEWSQSVVFSGGARGADQFAHKVALRKSVPTVVFLPSGLEALYPKELKDWVRPILDGEGLLVSEYPRHAVMRPYYFNQRNRLIAQSGSLLLVVESRLRSGSAMTASLAAQQGREVAAVPGHPSLVQMRGNIELIRSGAHVISSFADLKDLWLGMSQTRLVDANI